MAYITVLIIIAQYLFAYDPKTNPSPNESPLAQNGGFAANKTDVWVLGALRKMYPMKSLSHTTQKSLKVQQAFRDVCWPKALSGSKANMNETVHPLHERHSADDRLWNPDLWLRHPKRWFGRLPLAYTCLRCLVFKFDSPSVAYLPQTVHT